jgi:hypothetical protein
MAERTARPGEAAEATRILAIQGDSTTGVSAPSAGSDAARGTVDESSSLTRTFGGAFFFFRSFFFFRAVDCRVILPDASCAGERVRYGPTDHAFGGVREQRQLLSGMRTISCTCAFRNGESRISVRVIRCSGLRRSIGDLNSGDWARAPFSGVDLQVRSNVAAGGETRVAQRPAGDGMPTGLGE